MFLHTFYTADVANPTTKMQQLFVFNGCGLFSYPFIFWVIHFHRELSTCPLICHSRSKGKECTWLSKSLHNSRIYIISLLATFYVVCYVEYVMWAQPKPIPHFTSLELCWSFCASHLVDRFSSSSSGWKIFAVLRWAAKWPPPINLDSAPWRQWGEDWWWWTYYIFWDILPSMEP